MSKPRDINFVIKAAMIAVALCFDAAQFLLSLTGAGAIFTIPIDVLAWLTFFVWFILVSGWSGMIERQFKRQATLAVAALIEAIPFLNIIPGWTLAIETTLLSQKAEKIVRGNNEDH